MIQIKHPDLRPILQGIRQRSLIITGEADRITPLHKALEPEPVFAGLPDAFGSRSWTLYVS